MRANEFLATLKVQLFVGCSNKMVFWNDYCLTTSELALFKNSRLLVEMQAIASLRDVK
jgi:hypothetical protein